MNKTKSTPKREQGNLTLEQYRQANRYAMKVLIPLFLIITCSVAVFLGIVLIAWTGLF